MGIHTHTLSHTQRVSDPSTWNRKQLLLFGQEKMAPKNAHSDEMAEEYFTAPTKCKNILKIRTEERYFK